MTKRGSFTLMELVVVFAVIGALTALAIVGWNQYQSNEQAQSKTIKETSEAEYEPEPSDSYEINIPPSTITKEKNQTANTAPASSGSTESKSSALANEPPSINAPTTYTITSSNTSRSITADATTATCPADTTPYYNWKANNTAWVKGAEYSKVTYSLSPGQGVSLQAFIRCQKGSVVSAYTPSNIVSHARQRR